MYFFKKIVKFYKKKLTNKQNNNVLHTLSPTDDGKNIDTYLSSLEWALYNSKSIKNIAIAGPYGSGKSSIIDTYIKKHKSDHKYLKISLATFKDFNVHKKETSTSSSASLNDAEKNELERLIELSLLQQLFYHEKDSKIPDSNFKKIRKKQSINIITYTLLTILFIISCTCNLPENVVSNFIKQYTPFYSTIEKIINLIPWVSTILNIYISFFLFSCLYLIIKCIFRISKIKVTAQHAEIEIGNDINKSALNIHLDEILYFFEVSKYEVVFIEDLDRFGKSEIFVKLREINQLINNSNKIKQDVVFVYAIRDDVFMNKDRTKFFDFIIPVVPVINYSNSRDIIKNLLNNGNDEENTDNQNKYINGNNTVSEGLISDISLFIDDMRILFNILNEFYIYKEVLRKEELKVDNLLAIITYKNLFPKDFVDLMQNKGSLYNIINNRRTYLEKQNEEINNRIKAIQQKIENSQNQIQNNIKELRLIYISFAAEEIMKHGGNFFSDESGNKLSFTQLTEDKNFNLLRKDSLCYKEIDSSSIYAFPVKFDVIEKKVDKEEGYEKKERKIKIKLNPNKLYKDIEKLQKDKEELQRKKLKDLIIQEKINFTDDTDNQQKASCIERFLRNGYIDEDYVDYISLFYEGNLKKSDYDFLLKVKQNKKTAFDDPLTKKGVEEIIDQLNSSDFEKENILNFDLIDYLISPDEDDKKTKDTKRNSFYKQFTKPTEYRMQFINEFMDKITNNMELFICDLCSNWSGIWKVCKETPYITEEDKTKWFKLIIKYAKLGDIKNIFVENDPGFSSYCENYFNDYPENEKFKKIIYDLNIKFPRINPDTPNEDLNYLLDNNLFELNTYMLELLLSKKIPLSEDYKKSNYHFILSCGLPALEKYILENINTYVEEIYLRLEDNNDEPEDSYIQLLNNPKLKIELKDKIIQKENNEISNLTTVQDKNVQDLLLKNKKVLPSWENVYEYFKINKNTLTKTLIEYLNTIEIAEKLASISIQYSENANHFSKLIQDIIYEKELDNKTYRLITKEIPLSCSTFDQGIAPEKMLILIQNHIVRPSIETYNYLKTNYNGEEIDLLKQNPDFFVEHLNELNPSKKVMEAVINEIDYTCSSEAKEITYSYIIKHFSESELLSSSELQRFLIGIFIFNATHDSEITFSKKLQKAMLLNKNIDEAYRMKFFELSNSVLQNNELDRFFKSFENTNIISKIEQLTDK